MPRDGLNPGDRIGKLTLVERTAKPRPDGKREGWWKVVCDCGTEKMVLSRNLKLGATKSCGCVRANKFWGVLSNRSR